jgi:hypothetical protein
MTGLNTIGEGVARPRYSFGQASRNELVGVHPLMALLAERTIAASATYITRGNVYSALLAATAVAGAFAALGGRG